VDIYKLDLGLNIYRTSLMRSRLSPLRERKELISPNRKIIISTEVAGQQLHPDVIVSFDTYMHKCKEWRSENP
jgi:hypothetical protein